MNIDDIAKLMGKSRAEVEKILKQEDMIELNLKDTKQKTVKESGSIVVMN